MPTRSLRGIVAQRQLVTASPATTVEAAARLMRKHEVGALPVVEGERLVGIFTERDALFRVLAAARDPHTTRLSAVMTASPRTIHADKAMRDALMMMHEGGYRHVPVVDRDRLLGMVSARDALDPELDELGAEMLTREHLSQIL